MNKTGATAGATPAPTESPAVDSREVELKFSAAEPDLMRPDLEAWLAAAGPAKAQELRSVYFDTPGQDLRRHGVVVRLRRKKGQGSPLLGVKWKVGASEGFFSRGEIEVSCPGSAPDLALLDRAVHKRLSAIIGKAPLTVQFETRVRRRTVAVAHGSCTIEVAVDEGSVVAGARQQALTEVELELKSGDEADFLDFATSLVRALPLRLDTEPKSEKGFRLAAREAAEPRKALPVAFARATTVEDAFVVVIASTLSHFIGNWAAFFQTEQPESVHQMRVALRRMRSGLKVFKRLLANPELEGLRSEARRLATALGDARECDVFRENAELGPLDGSDGPQGRDSLLQAVRDRRRISYDAARKAIGAPEATAFVLAVQGYLVRRDWRKSLSEEALSMLSQPAEGFAAETLDRLYRKVRKQGRNLDSLSDDERHALRIALKNLRYAAEFFGGLFGHADRRKRFLARVSDLQDHLGARNDAVMARQVIASLAAGRDGELGVASAYVLGWYAHGSRIADAKLGKRWKALGSCRPFWT